MRGRQTLTFAALQRPKIFPPGGWNSYSVGAEAASYPELNVSCAMGNLPRADGSFEMRWKNRRRDANTPVAQAAVTLILQRTIQTTLRRSGADIRMMTVAIRKRIPLCRCAWFSAVSDVTESLPAGMFVDGIRKLQRRSQLLATIRRRRKTPFYEEAEDHARGPSGEMAALGGFPLER